MKIKNPTPKEQRRELKVIKDLLIEKNIITDEEIKNKVKNGNNN